MNQITINEEFCKECEYCMNFCPKKTILTKKDTVNKKGYYPTVAVNLTNCIACGICATVCPEGAIEIFKNSLSKGDYNG